MRLHPISHRRGFLHISVVAAALVLAGCAGAETDAPGAGEEQPAGVGEEQPAGVGEEQPAGAVGVQLFQWTWNSVATECTDTLGPLGYRYVLTSPPQEHVLGEEWWTAYQPVSYQVESRLGTREEFAAMVSTCEAAGVSIIADAVINHMTGQNEPGVGWAGSEYEHYSYPGLYEEADFHHCGLTPDDDIASYQDADQVQTCELLNLADLATGEEKVRDTIVTYLEDLLSLGVAGFRIDAAKHIAPEDVEAITGALPEGTIIWQEVIRGGGEPIQPEQYLDAGDVFEFGYGNLLKGMPATSLARFEELATGDAPGLLDSATAVVFVNNHDTERNGEQLVYTARERYALANVLMLAAPYGLPVVYSGYAFDTLDGKDAGPEQDGDGAVLDATCPADVGPAADYADGAWVCQHAWPQIAPMVAFRAAAGDAEMTDWWGEASAVAFGREDRGFVVVNGAADPVTQTWTTSLAAGDYCDVQTGTLADGACTGAVVTVAEDGTFTATVPGKSALAIHVDAQPGE